MSVYKVYYFWEFASQIFVNERKPMSQRHSFIDAYVQENEKENLNQQFLRNQYNILKSLNKIGRLDMAMRPVMPAVGRQEDQGFKANLSYPVKLRG